MQNKKGFTIIELIVVIAIIAILAAVVMVNVTQYINKSKDASIQANMDAIKTSAAVHMADPDNTSTYNAFVATAGYTVPKAAIESTNGTNTVVEFKSDGAFCISTVLPTSTAASPKEWCVDSTGYTGDATCTDTADSCT